MQYRGYYHDSETEFYYVSTRYYDPEVGRFLNADDIDYLGADGSHRTRIPDAMTKTTLIEVKNVKYISNTQQLRDFAKFAKDTQRSIELWVRPTTRIAKTVTNAGWNIKYLW